MEHRSVGKFIIFSIITLGIYTLVWFFWTTKEIKAAGGDVPTAWLQFIPLANIYFYWKHFAAAEQVTNGAVNGVLYFVLALFVSPIVSGALEQNEFNKLAGAAPAGGMPAAPAADQTPQEPNADAAPAAAPTPDVVPAPEAAAPAAEAPAADEQQPPVAPPPAA